MITYHSGYAAGDFPLLDAAAALWQPLSLRPVHIESEVGSRESLVKAYGQVGDTWVAFTDPTTVDGGPYPDGSLFWDYWDDGGRVMGDEMGGLADSPTDAVAMVVADLVARGYARVSDYGTLIETDWREECLT